MGQAKLCKWSGRSSALIKGNYYDIFGTPQDPYMYCVDAFGDVRSASFGCWGSLQPHIRCVAEGAKLEAIVKHVESNREQLVEYTRNIVEVPEEQPDPIESEFSRPVVPEVMKDLEARMAKGIETYGVPLKSHNGRSGLQDLYEELLDACCYIKQVMMEKED